MKSGGHYKTNVSTRGGQQPPNFMYSPQRADVLTNSVMSPHFHLGQVAGQGEPLSPLDFTIFMDPFNESQVRW